MDVDADWKSADSIVGRRFDLIHSHAMTAVPVVPRTRLIWMSQERRLASDPCTFAENESLFKPDSS
jgi:hypothetical protein